MTKIVWRSKGLREDSTNSSNGREWKKHKWIARKRGPGGKWIYDYGKGFSKEKELINQHTGGYTDKYSRNTVGRVLKAVSDISAPIKKHEVYNNNAVGRIARLRDDTKNVGRAFLNDISRSRKRR